MGFFIGEMTPKSDWDNFQRYKARNALSESPCLSYSGSFYSSFSSEGFAKIQDQLYEEAKISDPNLTNYNENYMNTGSERDSRITIVGLRESLLKLIDTPKTSLVDSRSGSKKASASDPTQNKEKSISHKRGGVANPFYRASRALRISRIRSKTVKTIKAIDGYLGSFMNVTRLTTIQNRKKSKRQIFNMHKSSSF